MESEFNLALSTLERIDKGIRICNDGLFNANFGLWLRGLYWFYGELSTWMNLEQQKKFRELLDNCKDWKTRELNYNLDQFLLATQYLRRIAHRNKLLLRESEDTMRHGGK